MAVVSKKQLQAKVSGEDDRGAELDKQLQNDAKLRLVAARQQKVAIEKDLKEGLFFTRPRLRHHVSSSTPYPFKSVKSDDEDMVVTGLGVEVAGDFATELTSAFFPQGTQWVTSGGEEMVAENQQEEFRKVAKEYDTQVFATITASNFDTTMALALEPQGALGTIALWIEQKHAINPVSVSEVPYCELEFNVEPDGTIGDRFRVWHVPAHKIESVLPGVVLPKKAADKVRSAQTSGSGKGNGGTVEVIWAYWRDYSVMPDFGWVHVLMVEGEVVERDTMVGEGAIPLVIMRFKPDRLHAWGNGPTLEALPDLRTHDVILECFEDRADQATHPAFTYPGEGAMDLEDGIEAGTGYPVRPGMANDIKSLYFEGNPDLGLVNLNEIERRIRRKHFADYPEQRGDTPPTATQWIDEMARAQRRIGTPGLAFWHEGPRVIYLRFAWLAEKQTDLVKPSIDGKAVSLVPNNPATKARDQQKVQVAVRALEIAKGMFPMTSQAAIDERATIEGILQTMGDELVKLRSEEEVQAFIEQIMSEAQAGGSVFANDQERP